VTRGHFIALVLSVAFGMTLAEYTPWYVWPLATLAFGAVAGYASIDLDRWFYREGKR
jgi:hypothetical protein